MSGNSLTSLPRLFSEGLFSSLAGSPNKNTQVQVSSRPFALFVRNVNTASSKYEEEQLILRELATLKENFSQPSLSMVEIRDCLCRVVYCHMLGYDVSWSHIHALKLAQQGSLLEKKIGYLASCLMLDRDCEVVMLLTGTITKDMASSNILDNLAALAAASQLVSKEAIPFILQSVLDKLKHPRELVRQKAVMCLHQFQLLAPDLLDHNQEDLQRALYDKDPSVMIAAVHAVTHQVMRNPGNYESIGQSLLDILRQITDRKMSSSFEYHSIQLPWLQIQLLRCLSLLVTHHDRLKQSLSVLMKDILQRLNVKENMGFAILYECICCIIVMRADQSLLDVAAQHVGRLLRSSEPNLKYIGVKALMQLVQADSQYAMNYQTLIVDSLESEEVNIQKKMYKLLYQIANASNVEAVCSKLLKYFSMTTDRFWRSEVIGMVIDLAKRFPISPEWQIQTILSCVQQGGDLIDSLTLKGVLDVFQKEYILKTDVKGQQLLVQKCVSCLLMVNTTPSLIHVAAWVVGELCLMLQKMPEDRVISLFTKHLCNPELPFSVKSCVVSALQKLLMNQIVSHATMADNLRECMLEQHFVIKQRLALVFKVCEEKILLEKCDGDTLDMTLSFLDDHVSQCLESGGSPYIPSHLRKQSTDTVKEDTKLFQWTSTPEAPGSSEGRVRSHSRTSSSKTMDDDEPGIKIGPVKQVWGRQGRLNEEKEALNSMVALNQDVPSSSKTIEKSELKTALFSGIASAKTSHGGGNLFEADEEETGFTSELSDDAGWKSAFSNLSTQSMSQTTNNQGLASTTGTDIEVAREQQSNYDQHGLGLNSMEMIEIEEAIGLTHDLENRNSAFDSQNLYLNSTCTSDSNGNTNFMFNQKVLELGESSGSYNDTFGDAMSSIRDDNSSFLNISVSSTDKNQVVISNFKSGAGVAKSEFTKDGELDTQHINIGEDVNMHGDNTNAEDSEIKTGEQQSIYSEGKSDSLYDKDDDS